MHIFTSVTDKSVRLQYLCDFRQNTVGIYKISMVRAPDGEQFAQETHRLVLKTLGKFSRLRANSAHFVGHLPTAAASFGDGVSPTPGSRWIDPPFRSGKTVL
jgi:hypothetical protein